MVFIALIFNLFYCKVKEKDYTDDGMGQGAWGKGKRRDEK
jgi:hypothetical protein